jgi:hypothetical protein
VPVEQRGVENDGVAGGVVGSTLGVLRRRIDERPGGMPSVEREIERRRSVAAGMRDGSDASDQEHHAEEGQKLAVHICPFCGGSPVIGSASRF